MTFRRWTATTAAMCAVAWVLWTAGPRPPEVRAALGDPQGLVDRAGPDALVLVAVPVLAWLCWAWGAVGLLLTAASTVPGWTGRVSGFLLVGVLPAGARRAAAVALGLTLGTAAPIALLPTAPPMAVAAADVLDSPGQVPLDWPTGRGQEVPSDEPGTPSSVPDWPPAGAGEHVVLRGDCLWDIAADWLQRAAPGAPVPDAAVHDAVQAWWQANAAVIGPDPDLLLPGQVLRTPR